jgi:hypothetical protein
MTAAGTLLNRLIAAGLSVQITDGNLDIRGPQSAIDALPVEELRARKPEILALLSSAREAAEPIRVEYPLNRIRKQKAGLEKKRFVLSPEELRCIRAMLDRLPEERGVWVQVLRGRWCHYIEPPTEAQLKEEREWQLKFIEDQTKDRRH